MKFIICGLGSIGRRHLRNLLALGETDIHLYRTHQGTLPDDELAGFPIYTDFNQALDQHPAAVIISNPTALHLDLAIPAAQAGCSIFMEKPVSHSMERIPDLEQALIDGGGTMLVGYQFRFNPGLRVVAEALQEGQIGRTLSARAHWGEFLPGWHPWEDYRRSYSARQDLGGGVILTLSHTIDYLTWFFGKASDCWAFTSDSGQLELQGVEDTAEIGLRYHSGVLGSLHMDFLQQPPAHFLEITGTQGMIRWDNGSGLTEIITDREAPRRYEPPEGFERNTMFLDQMKHFIAVARGEAQPLCSLQDGVEALKVSLAALESSKTGLKVDVSPAAG